MLHLLVLLIAFGFGGWYGVGLAALGLLILELL